MSPVSIIGTFVLLLASFAIAKPLPGDFPGISPVSTLNPRRPNPLAIHLPPTQLIPTRAISNVLNPIQNGMISRMYYSKLGTMFPSIVAAQALEAFYQAIAAKAHAQWHLLPETDLFIISQGQIELSFLCKGADIPWDFIAAFAQQMADNVSNGWVEIYDSIWTNPARTIGIHVALRLKDAAGL